MPFLQELFIKAANKYPDNCALIWDTSSRISEITYSELLNETDVVVDNMISAGVDGEYVGILIGSLMLYPAVAIGILRSNCAYVSLDWQSTLAWNMQLIEKLNIRFVLTSNINGLTDKWKLLRKLYIHNESVYIMSTIKATRAIINRGNNFMMAYAIQTSGTTGIPKIVQVPHQSIVPNILQLRDIFNMGPCDTVFLSAPLTFDPSVVETFIALSSGACLLIAPHCLRAAPGPLLFQFLFNRPRKCGKLSVLSVTPSYAACLLCSSSSSNILSEHIDPNLKILSLGGEPCPPISVLHEWKNKLGGKARIFSLYGITEVSCWASIAEVELDDKNVSVVVVKQQSNSLFDEVSSALCVESTMSDKNELEVESSNEILESCKHLDDSKVLQNKFSPVLSVSNVDLPVIQQIDNELGMNGTNKSSERITDVPLGSPMMHTSMEVRDSIGRIVTDGEGELFIGSDTRVCLLDDEDVNIAETGNVVFRATGDIVKVQRGRNLSEEISPLLFYVGRQDGAVKRFGRWIFMKSIESVASGFLWRYESTQCISIEASCCIWSSKGNGRGKLGLFVVPSAKDMFQESKSMKQKFVADLMSHLFKVLPSNSWPDLILPINELPLTKHAKVNKEKLISIVKDLLVGEVTKGLCADSHCDDGPISHFKKLWMQYLNLSIEPLSTDRFLMSGGDSLLALRLISELEEIMNCSMPPLLLTTLLNGTYSEACACIQLQETDKLEHDAGKNITSTSLGKRIQIAEFTPFEKRFKSSKSDSEASKIEEMYDDDHLCIEYRRGGVSKYNLTAKLVPTIMASQNVLLW